MCWFKLGAKGGHVSSTLSNIRRELHEQQSWESAHSWEIIFIYNPPHPPLLSPFAHCFRKWDFAPRPSILHRPHEDIGLCQEAELGPACWNPWWAPCLCLRMWKKPGTGPRSASQNYITIIPLSVSEASWAPAQSGRKVGERWQRVDVWLETTDGG